MTMVKVNCPLLVLSGLTGGSCCPGDFLPALPGDFLTALPGRPRESLTIVSARATPCHLVVTNSLTHVDPPDRGTASWDRLSTTSGSSGCEGRVSGGP